MFATSSYRAFLIPQHMALARKSLSASQEASFYCAIQSGHVLRSDAYAPFDRQHEAGLGNADHYGAKRGICMAECAYES